MRFQLLKIVTMIVVLLVLSASFFVAGIRIFVYGKNLKHSALPGTYFVSEMNDTGRLI
jgi:hypothetical protein